MYDFAYSTKKEFKPCDFYKRHGHITDIVICKRSTFTTDPIHNVLDVTLAELDSSVRMGIALGMSLSFRRYQKPECKLCHALCKHAAIHTMSALSSRFLSHRCCTVYHIISDCRVDCRRELQLLKNLTRVISMC